MPDTYITLKCSLPECTEDLVIKKSNYNSKRAYGQKNFYHRECMYKIRETIKLVKMPPKSKGIANFRTMRSEW